MLRQLRSQGIPSALIALGKMLGLIAILGLALCRRSALASPGSAGTSTGPELAATLPRLGALAWSTRRYFLTVLGVAAAVSTISRSARAALIVLLGFWLATASSRRARPPRSPGHLAPAASPAVFARELEAAVARHEEGVAERPPGASR